MLFFRYIQAKMTDQERERVFLWIPVVFAAGIAVYFSLPFELSIWWSLVIIEAVIFLAYFWRHAPEKLAVLGWAAVFVLGFVNIQVRAYHLNTVPLLQQENVLYLRGYVERTGYNYRGRQYLILSHLQDFDGTPIAGKYRITPLSQSQKIKTGMCVETVASLRPLMLPNMPGTYQFNRKQFFDGLKGTGYTDVSVQPLDCASLGVHPGRFIPFVDGLRDRIVSRIYAVLNPDTAGIAAAVIAGERGKISKEQTQNYRDAGLAHFLAISGLHVGMIAGMMFLLVRWGVACIPAVALKYDTKKIAAGAAIVMSFVYLVISGWQISTQRAFIMTLLVMIGILVGRKAISMRMIAWAALVILILEPQVLISAGFQMSFAAVMMLVAFYEKYAGKWHRSQAGGRCMRWCGAVMFYLIGIVVADFIASMATLPFAVYHFNRISLYTSLANLAAGPVIGLWIMPCVLLSLLLMPFGLDKYVLLLTGQGIEIVNRITQTVAGLDNASYRVLSMPSWGLAVLVVGGLWLALWQSRWRHWGWILIVCGFASVWMVKIPDILVDHQAKTFAVRAKDGRLLILPNRGNYFTKQMWSEKLAQAPLDEKEKEKLRRIYKGQETDTNWIELVCDQEKCLYKNKAELTKKGGFMLEGRDYSTAGALAVYGIDGKPEVTTVKDVVGDRYWNRI